MSKRKLIKRIDTLQIKNQELWAKIETDYGQHCQTIGRELSELQKKIESGETKPIKK